MFFSYHSHVPQILKPCSSWFSCHAPKQLSSPAILFSVYPAMLSLFQPGFSCVSFTFLRYLTTQDPCSHVPEALQLCFHRYQTLSSYIRSMFLRLSSQALQINEPCPICSNHVPQINEPSYSDVLAVLLRLSIQVLQINDVPDMFLMYCSFVPWMFSTLKVCICLEETCNLTASIRAQGSEKIKQYLYSIILVTTSRKSVFIKKNSGSLPPPYPDSWVLTHSVASIK